MLKEYSDVEEEKHVMAVTETEGSVIVQYEKDYPEESSTDEEEKFDKEFFEFKSAIEAKGTPEDGQGTFEGYGSVFNNTDLGNDVILKGAFTKSIKKTGSKGIKLLYHHKTDMPIGVFDEIEEDSKGLRVKGRLAMKTQAGQEAYELMKMGALDGLSIGFRVSPKGQSYDAKTKRRLIKEVELMEISLVTFPMNPRAKIRSVKGSEMSIREWEGGLRDVFQLSRSEAKISAKAVYNSLNQREAEENAANAIVDLTNKLKLISKGEN